MAANDSFLQRAGLSGSADLLILTYPTIRSRIRRHDPDGLRAFPYFSGLTGTTLVAVLRPSPGAAPTATITVNFASDGYDDAIIAINTAGGAHLKAFDDAGFLVLQGLHGGGKNLLEISITSTGLDILGFDAVTLGGISQAGDFAPSSAGGSQANPPGTMLVAHDEDFKSSIVNRAVVGSLRGIDQLLADLDHEVAGLRTVLLAHAGGSSFSIASGYNVRLATDILGGGSFGFDYIQVYDTNGNWVYNGNTRVQVASVTYGPSVDPASHFTAWGTPDGKAVANPSGTGLQLKTALTAITEIRGNLITAPGSQFVTNNVQPRDTVTIRAANNDIPFNHNGEYVVLSVPDEDHIYVRPLGSREPALDVTEDRPRALNPNLPGGTSYGTVAVYVGLFVPTMMKNSGGNDKMIFNLNASLSGGNYLVVFPAGTTLREMATNPLLSTNFFGPIHLKDPDLAYKGQANVFRLLNTFNVGAAIGDNIVTAALAKTERVRYGVAPAATAAFTLLSSSLIIGSANAIRGRTYAAADADGLHLVATVNAAWDQTLNAGAGYWVKDHAGDPAVKLRMTKNQVKLSYRSADPNWTDGSWVDPIIANAATGDLTATGTISASILAAVTGNITTLNSTTVNATDLNSTGLATVRKLALIKDVTTNREAQLLAEDVDGSVRYQLDHIGYPMSRLVIFDEYWWWPDTVSFNAAANDGDGLINGKWEIKTSIAASGSWVSSWDDPIMAMCLTLNSTNGNNVKTWVQTRASNFPLPGAGARNNVVLVAEWEAKISATNANRVWMIGFFNDNTDPLTSANTGCWLQSTNGGNWFAKSLGAAAQDTGVAVNFSNFQRFRIEIHGSASPFGVSAGGAVVANFFIDGGFVAQVTHSVTNALVAGKFGFYAKNTGTPASTYLTMGPIRIVWNRYDSLPNL